MYVLVDMSKAFARLLLDERSEEATEYTPLAKAGGIGAAPRCCCKSCTEAREEARSGALKLVKPV